MLSVPRKKEGSRLTLAAYYYCCRLVSLLRPELQGPQTDHPIVVVVAEEEEEEEETIAILPILSWFPLLE